MPPAPRAFSRDNEHPKSELSTGGKSAPQAAKAKTQHGRPGLTSPIVKLPEHYDGFIDGCNLGDNKSAVCICSGVIQHGLMSEIEA
jgi:hypothetical protein